MTSKDSRLSTINIVYVVFISFCSSVKIYRVKQTQLLPLENNLLLGKMNQFSAGLKLIPAPVKEGNWKQRVSSCPPATTDTDSGEDTHSTSCTTNWDECHQLEVAGEKVRIK